MMVGKYVEREKWRWNGARARDRAREGARENESKKDWKWQRDDMACKMPAPATTI